MLVIVAGDVSTFTVSGYAFSAPLNRFSVAGPDGISAGICRLICAAELKRIGAASPLNVTAGVPFAASRFVPYKLTTAPAYAPVSPGSAFVSVGMGTGKTFTGVA